PEKARASAKYVESRSSLQSGLPAMTNRAAMNTMPTSIRTRLIAYPYTLAEGFANERPPERASTPTSVAMIMYGIGESLGCRSKATRAPSTCAGVRRGRVEAAGGARLRRTASPDTDHMHPGRVLSR